MSETDQYQAIEPMTEAFEAIGRLARAAGLEIERTRQALLEFFAALDLEGARRRESRMHAAYRAKTRRRNRRTR